MTEAKTTREFLEGKSFSFALRVAKAGRVLSKRGVEQLYVRQLLRSGTSIGANLAEATVAYSKAELASKMGISLKECRETIYWIRLLCELNSLTPDEADSLLVDAEELAKLLYSSIRTLRKSL